jgi:hypothetical protein
MNRKICSQYKQGTSMPSIDPWYDDKQNKLNHVDDKESSLLSVLPVGVYQTGIDYLDSASRNLFCCQNTCFPLLDLHHQSLEEVLPLSVEELVTLVRINFIIHDQIAACTLCLLYSADEMNLKYSRVAEFL